MLDSFSRICKISRKSSSHFPSRSRKSVWDGESRIQPPSDVKKFINFSKNPTRNSSQRQGLASNTERMSIPISTMKMGGPSRKSGVQSDRRAESLSCTHQPKHSQTQLLCSRDYQNGRTLPNSKRSIRRPRRQLGVQNIARNYLDFRQKSLKAKKKGSRKSSGKAKPETPKKTREMSLVLENENKEFQRRISMGSKKPASTLDTPKPGLARRKKNFWVNQLVPVADAEDQPSIVSQVNAKRRQLLANLIGDRKENLSQAQIVKLLRQQLKSKKKTIFKLIQDNRKLEYKWKETNRRLENFHQSKIERFEYLKKLILRDKNHLSRSEMCLVSQIEKFAKPQIQFDISKILLHETRFVRMGESSLATSQVHLDPLLLSNQAPPDPKKVTQIYSDSIILT